MKSNGSVVVLVALVLILVGGIAFVATMTALDWDFKRLGTKKFETSTHEIGEEFSSISIKTKTADVVFLPAEDGACKIVCYDQEKMKHAVSVENGVLTVRVRDTRRWYDHIGFTFKTPKITVYLPAAEYEAISLTTDTGDVKASALTCSDLTVKVDTGDVSLRSIVTAGALRIETDTGDVALSEINANAVSVKTDTGDAALSEINANAVSVKTDTGDASLASVSASGALRIETDTGDVKVSTLACSALTVKVDTGDVSLKDAIASGALRIETDTGDVQFERCDAGEIFMKTDTGDVRGSFLTDKIVFATAHTGKVNVPKLTTGGRCEIETDTGDIKVTIVGK